MCLNTINSQCNIISGFTNNGTDSDILHTFILSEPAGYKTVNIPSNVSYQKVFNERNEHNSSGI